MLNDLQISLGDLLKRPSQDSMYLVLTQVMIEKIKKGDVPLSEWLSMAVKSDPVAWTEPLLSALCRGNSKEDFKLFEDCVLWIQKNKREYINSLLGKKNGFFIRYLATGNNLNHLNEAVIDCFFENSIYHAYKKKLTLEDFSTHFGLITNVLDVNKSKKVDEWFEDLYVPHVLTNANKIKTSYEQGKAENEIQKGEWGMGDAFKYSDFEEIEHNGWRSFVLKNPKEKEKENPFDVYSPFVPCAIAGGTLMSRIENTSAQIHMLERIDALFDKKPDLDLSESLKKEKGAIVFSGKQDNSWVSLLASLNGAAIDKWFEIANRRFPKTDWDTFTVALRENKWPENVSMGLERARLRKVSPGSETITKKSKYL